MKKRKIVICGGHFAPAWAVTERLKEKGNFEIHYVSRIKPFEGDNTFSFEYHELSRSKIAFHSFNTGRLIRKLNLSSVLSLARLPQGLFSSFQILKKVQPEVVLSFGGYVALPVCLVALFLKIPVFTHEQTAILGLTNRIIARFAKILFLSYENTAKVPSKAYKIVVGNPLRLSMVNSQISTFSRSGSRGDGYTDFGDKRKPLIYVTGGSTGARKINQTIIPIIPQLVQKYRLIHQCGEADNLADFQLLLKAKASLPKAVQIDYKVVKYVPSEDVGQVLRKAKFIIGRSGGNIVSEIAFLKVPAILIPLPHAADNEQYVNARILEEQGAAKIINQKKLTSKLLLKSIGEFEDKYSVYKTNIQWVRNKMPVEAGEKIIEEIETYLSKHKKE